MRAGIGHPLIVITNLNFRDFIGETTVWRKMKIDAKHFVSQIAPFVYLLTQFFTF